MPDFLNASVQPDTAMPDTAVICVDQLHALAGLLSLEEVVEQCSAPSTVPKVSIFGLFEDALADVCAVLARTVSSKAEEILGGRPCTDCLSHGNYLAAVNPGSDFR
ncbi:hypothetical protein [Paraburkholderia sprentiae]|uniref:hypothetical protein n=1 Tax=Paraburkholderia sprentiae TaxID=948107 RepID=UPI001E37DDAA|nr:hypothetical protein [Paraburkholderia sprentiae]